MFHPRDIETVLVNRAPAFIRFRKLTKVIAQWNGDSLIVAEGARWRDRHRKVQPAFQTRRVKEYACTAADHAERLCARFDAGIAAGSVTVDTDAVMARLTLDIATHDMIFRLFPKVIPLRPLGFDQALGDQTTRSSPNRNASVIFLLFF